MPSRNLKALVVLALAGAVLWVYLPAGDFEFVSFDDSAYVYENPHVRTGFALDNLRWAFTRSHSANWHPVTWVSHMVDWELFGEDAGGHHLTSVLIHLVNTILLVLVLSRMTGNFWPSAVVAGLFGLHPLHVESVAWISERKDVLSTLFMFLALMAYADYVRQPRPGPGLRVVLYFALGLMAKPMLVTFPFLLLLLDFWPLRRVGLPGARDAGAWGRVIGEKVPLFLMSLASCWVTFAAQKGDGAVGAYSLGVRSSNAAVSYASYLVKTVWPLNLAMFYPHPEKVLVPETIAAVLCIIAITATVVAQARRRPWLAMGWLWYIGALLPVIGIVQVGSQAMADRYTYVPLIGVFVAVAWSVMYAFSRRRSGTRAAGVAAVIAIGVLAPAARRQVATWRDNGSLYRHALVVTRDNYFAHNNLGAVFLTDGVLDSAERHAREAVRIRPAFELALHNLGLVHAKRGEHDSAIALYRQALGIDTGFVAAIHNMGESLEALGDSAAGPANYRKALALDPSYWPSHASLGRALLAYPDSLPAAAAHLEQVLVLKPRLWETHYFLALACDRMGNPARAERHFVEAIAIEPGSWALLNNFGHFLLEHGKLGGAVDAFSHAAALRPDSAKPWLNRGQAFMAMGRSDSAEVCLTRAASLEPGLAPVHYHLGGLYAGRGMSDSARAHYLIACRLDPGIPEFATIRDSLEGVGTE